MKGGEETTYALLLRVREPLGSRSGRLTSPK